MHLYLCLSTSCRCHSWPATTPADAGVAIRILRLRPSAIFSDAFVGPCRLLLQPTTTRRSSTALLTYWGVDWSFSCSLSSKGSTFVEELPARLERDGLTSSFRSSTRFGRGPTWHRGSTTLRCALRSRTGSMFKTNIKEIIFVVLQFFRRNNINVIHFVQKCFLDYDPAN